MKSRGVLLTLVIFRLKRFPEPESGVESVDVARMRKVLTSPVPGRTLPVTFQLPPVSPVFDTGVF